MSLHGSFASRLTTLERYAENAAGCQGYIGPSTSGPVHYLHPDITLFPGNLPDYGRVCRLVCRIMSCEVIELIMSCCRNEDAYGFGGRRSDNRMGFPAFGPWANANVTLSVLTSERLPNPPGPLKWTSDQVGPKAVIFFVTRNWMDPPKTPFPDNFCA